MEQLQPSTISLEYPSVEKVLILGGTHGNELSGVYLQKHWKKNPSFIQRSSFQTILDETNPPAVKNCKRFIDTDMNRCFTDEILSESSPPEYEKQRALELNAQYGPKKSSSAIDFIIDLHNTNTNNGVSLVVEDSADIFIMQACAFVHAHLGAPCRVFLTEDFPPYSVCSVGKHSLGVEIGPQSHGILRADVTLTMKRVVALLLDFTQLFNAGHVFPPTRVGDIFRAKERVNFPRDAGGDFSGVIHPSLQDNDWSRLNPGDPIFLTFDEEVITWPGEAGNREMHVAFVNEAAYYEKDLAFWLCTRESKEVVGLHADKKTDSS